MESTIPTRKPTGDLSKLSRRYSIMPSESELAAPFLNSRDATSSVECGYETATKKSKGSKPANKDSAGIWKIYPVSIPVKAVGIWLACCCLIIFPTIMYFTGGLVSDTGNGIGIGGAFCGAGLFVLTPIMMGMLHLANQSVGTEAYLRLDESKQSFELPRLQVSFQVDQVHEVISIRVDDVVQTHVLIEETKEQGGWTVYHVGNLCAGSHSISSKLADKLGVEFQKFKYTAKEVRRMRQSSLMVA